MSLIPLVVLTNRREHATVDKAIHSAWQYLRGTTGLVIVDDSGSHAYRDWLRDAFDPDEMFSVGPVPCGYDVAMDAVFKVAKAAGGDGIFFLEDDFTFNVDVNAQELAAITKQRPKLAQVALQRQPWFANEVEAGGMLQALVDQGNHFTQWDWAGPSFLEHTAIFTGNPCYIPRRTYENFDWPSGQWSESRFSKMLFRAVMNCAYLGTMDSPPHVEHIGVRSGFGY